MTISFQPVAISTADRSIHGSSKFCRRKIHSMKGKQFQEEEEENISRKALDEREILDILSQNNEEYKSESLEKIKDFSTSLRSSIAANKHINLSTLLGSGSNSAIKGSENVTFCPIALHLVSYCHPKM